MAGSFSIFAESEMSEGLLKQDQKEINAINTKISELSRQKWPYIEQIRRIKTIEENAAFYESSTFLFHGCASDADIWRTNKDRLIKEREELRLKVMNINATTFALNKRKKEISIAIDQDKENSESSDLSSGLGDLQKRIADYRSIFVFSEESSLSEASDASSEEELDSPYYQSIPS